MNDPKARQRPFGVLWLMCVIVAVAAAVAVRVAFSGADELAALASPVITGLIVGTASAFGIRARISQN